MLDGTTALLLHLGHPTRSFTAPLIYNPWFDDVGANARVVPLGVRPEEFALAFGPLMRASNVRGALITMPYKVPVLGMVDVIRPGARIAGAGNAVRVDDDGRLVADMFDGAGFVAGMRRHGREIAGCSALVVGAGGVGSAIAASLAANGAAAVGVFDIRPAPAQRLAARLREQYPGVSVRHGSNDPAGHDVVVNATPLGMRDGDHLPVDVSRVDPSAFIGDVVLSRATTPFVAAARRRGCQAMVGTDMLFEQIPAYLDFFGFGPAPTPERLRELARLPAE